MNTFLSFSPENLKEILIGNWNVPAIKQRSVGPNAHWTMPEIRISWTFIEDSVDIQKCISWPKGKMSYCVYYWSEVNLCLYSIGRIHFMAGDNIASLHNESMFDNNYGKSVCLFGVFRSTREFFTHFEKSPLPVKGRKFWSLLANYGHWAVRVL